MREVKKMVEVNREAFTEAWKQGQPMKQIAEKFGIALTHVYFYVGKFGLDVRPRPRMTTTVTSTGIIALPRKVCEELKLKKGDRYVFTIMDIDDKQVKLTKHT